MLRFAKRNHFKVAMIGDGGVGKTCLCSRAIKQLDNLALLDYYMLTVGLELFTYKSDIVGTEVTLQVWDLAGQDRFRIFVEDFVKGTSAIILTFALNDMESFYSLSSKWLPLLREHTLDTTPVMLVGTKCDLPLSIPDEMVELFRRSLGRKFLGYWKTSAKDNTNVQAFFDDLVRIIYASSYEQPLIPVSKKVRT